MRADQKQWLCPELDDLPSATPSRLSSATVEHHSPCDGTIGLTSLGLARPSATAYYMLTPGGQGVEAWTDCQWLRSKCTFCAYSEVLESSRPDAGWQDDPQSSITSQLVVTAVSKGLRRGSEGNDWDGEDPWAGFGDLCLLCASINMLCWGY